MASLYNIFIKNFHSLKYYQESVFLLTTHGTSAGDAGNPIRGNILARPQGDACRSSPAG